MTVLAATPLARDWYNARRMLPSPDRIRGELQPW